jgi:hypothetical protein
MGDFKLMKVILTILFLTFACASQAQNRYTIVYNDSTNLAKIVAIIGKPTKDAKDTVKPVIFERFKTIVVKLNASKYKAVKPLCKSIDKEDVKAKALWDRQFTTFSPPVYFNNSMYKVSKLHERGIKGQGVRVAVFDDGCSPVATMPDITRLDFSVGTGTPNSPSGHGTAVCRYIADTIDGIAPKCKIYSLKTFQTGGGYTQQSFLAGMQWVLDSNIKVITFSYSATGNYIEAPLLQFVNSGGIVLGASGNTYNDWMVGPANYNYAIAVNTTSLATNNDSAVGSWIQYPNYPPFNNPNLQNKISICGRNNDAGVTYNIGGTSQATPQAAGIVVLMCQYLGNNNINYLKAKKMLEKSAKKIPYYTTPDYYNSDGVPMSNKAGAGRLNWVF